MGREALSSICVQFRAVSSFFGRVRAAVEQQLAACAVAAAALVAVDDAVVVGRGGVGVGEGDADWRMSQLRWPTVECGGVVEGGEGNESAQGNGGEHLLLMRSSWSCQPWEQQRDA